MMAKNECVLFMLFIIYTTDAAVCLDGTDSLTDPYEIEVLTSYGHYTQMACCISEDPSMNITWYKLDNDTSLWNVITMDAYNYLFLEKNQVLAIKRADFSNRGAYKCVSTSGMHNLHGRTKSFSVQVDACDPLPRGPFVIAPMACEKTVVKLGESVTLPCTGYFGCDSGADLRVVKWFVANKTDDDWKPVSEEMKYIEQSFQKDGSILGANLTIPDISDDDFTKRFTCTLVSSQSVHGQTNIVASLVKAEGTPKVFVETASFMFLLILVAVILVIIFSMISITICRIRKIKQKSINRVSIQTKSKDIFEPCLQAKKHLLPM